MRIELGKHRGVFCAVIYDDAGVRHRRSLGTPVSQGAEAGRAALDQFKRDAAAALTGTPQTVSDIYAAYARHRAGKPSHPRIIDCWKRLQPAFGPLRPDAITPGACLDYTGRRLAVASAGTVHVELGYLRAALRHAERQGWIARAPHVPLPQKPPPRDHRLTMEQIRRLIDCADAFHVKLFIVLAVTTAARSAALLDLTWERVDFERGLINLRDPAAPETRKGRATPPMNATARQWLTEARAAAISDHVIEWGGKRVASVKKGFAAAARRAGLRCSPHVLRHSAACIMAESGVDMAQIAQYLGHRDSRTTERIYARFSPDYMRKAAGALEIQ